MTRKIVLEDVRRHSPDANSPASWQESFYLGWVDLDARAMGTHHISLRPGGDKDTHVWSWVMLDGKVIGRAQQHGLDVPEGDYDDLKVGNLHLRIKESLREIDLTATYDDAVADVAFTAACDPLELPLDFDEMKLGDRHYEIMGTVKGTLTHGDRKIPIHAGCWTDHSWGGRDFGSIVSHRWLWASFGADLSMSVFIFVTNDRLHYQGWVVDGGEIHIVTYAELHSIVNDDGISPEGCDAIIRTDSLKTYRVKGRCIDTALLGGHNYCVKNGLTEFECGGRIGSGILEFNDINLSKPTPNMLKELGLA
jgi:hypothetical protein